MQLQESKQTQVKNLLIKNIQCVCVRVSVCACVYECVCVCVCVWHIFVLEMYFTAETVFKRVLS